MSTGARLTDCRGAVWPLVSSMGRVTVDGHAICDRCGVAVVPAGPDRWQHAGSEGTRAGGSPWLDPVDPDELLRLDTYAEFGLHYPWTVRPELGAGAVTTPGEWDEARHRISAYTRLLGSLDAAAPSVDVDANPYLRLFETLTGGPAPHRPMSRGLAQVLNLPGRRRELASRFAWAIPTAEALAALARHAPLVECAAGTGYWAALLATRGTDVVACDVHPPDRAANDFHDAGRTWHDVRAATAAHAAACHPERTLLLCWPPPDDDAASYAALRAYRGETLIYIGEGPDGASGSVRFHRELALNWHPVEQHALPNWPGLRDRLTVYARNPIRRPHRERDRCPDCGRFRGTGSIGRCDACFAARPPALALRHGRHRIEYPQDALDRMPLALRRAFETSPARIEV